MNLNTLGPRVYLWANNFIGPQEILSQGLPPGVLLSVKECSMPWLLGTIWEQKPLHALLTGYHQRRQHKYSSTILGQYCSALTTMSLVSRAQSQAMAT